MRIATQLYTNFFQFCKDRTHAESNISQYKKKTGLYLSTHIINALIPKQSRYNSQPFLSLAFPHFICCIKREYNRRTTDFSHSCTIVDTFVEILATFLHGALCFCHEYIFACIIFYNFRPFFAPRKQLIGPSLKYPDTKPPIRTLPSAPDCVSGNRIEESAHRA